jgi:hypoxanthine phosphoribosyltransferase
MLTEDGKHLYVSYDEYHNLIEKLAIKIHQSGWQFDTILCLARGGMRPGDILSRIFDKPLAIMSTSSYRAEAGTQQGNLDIARFITTPKGEIAGKVLLVDDLADTGHTLIKVIDQLKNNYKPITELRGPKAFLLLRQIIRSNICRRTRGFTSRLKVMTPRAWSS